MEDDLAVGSAVQVRGFHVSYHESLLIFPETSGWCGFFESIKPKKTCENCPLENDLIIHTALEVSKEYKMMSAHWQVRRR